MAKVTIDFETSNPKDVREVYLMLIQLVNRHFPVKQEEKSEVKETE